MTKRHRGRLLDTHIYMKAMVTLFTTVVPLQGFSKSLTKLTHVLFQSQIINFKWITGEVERMVVLFVPNLLWQQSTPRVDEEVTIDTSVRGTLATIMA